MTPFQLHRRASELGLRLEPRGDKLAVIPAERLTPDFAAELRQHKREILDWLETRTVQLTPDQVPWLHVSRQILAGEFDGADKSTRESLRIGLRSIAHPLCQQALVGLSKRQPNSTP